MLYSLENFLRVAMHTSSPIRGFLDVSVKAGGEPQHRVSSVHTSDTTNTNRLYL